MAFKLKRSSREPMSEINVTPFVDVMLVLLIVFMVTAPLLTVGVQVDLPESSADSLPEEQEPLTLSINSKGEIFIQESKVEFDNVIDKLSIAELNHTWRQKNAATDVLSFPYNDSEGEMFLCPDIIIDRHQAYQRPVNNSQLVTKIRVINQKRRCSDR